MTSIRRVTKVGWGPRDDEVTLAEFGEGGSDIEHVLCFESKVELLYDCLGEEFDECRRISQRGNGDPANQVGGEPGHDGEILLDPAAHGTVVAP
jgi:hypothetical protein